MLCKIADLFTEIPATGGLAPRCGNYLSEEKNDPDIVILEELYNRQNWKNLSDESAVYLESGFQFYRKLLHFDGMMLHSSAVAYEGRAYLFSGPCGVGKSTHTRLWQSTFGEEVKNFNDDKPALRRIDGVWYAYGTPWCGKDGININMKAPLSGICFLRQGLSNEIRRLDASEAVTRIISQTTCHLSRTDEMDLMLNNVERLVCEIPIYELSNRPEPEAARLSYEAMRRGGMEIGLK